MTAYEVLGDAQLAAHTAHLVLEEPLQRFAQREVHLLGQTTHIMMALDDLACDIEALDAVGIDGSLGKPLGIGYLVRLLVEHLHEVAADDLALLLGFCHAFQVAEEAFAGIHTYNVQAQALVVVHHIGELVLAEHAVIYEDTGELVADGTVEQNGCHAAIHASREAKDDTVGAYLLAELLHGSIHKIGRRPVLTASADIHHKVAQQLGALQGVEHFGVELHAPYRLVVGGIGCIFHLVGAGYGVEALGQSRDGVSVAHPHLAALLKPMEERVVEVDGGQVGATILAAASRLHLAAQRVAHELRSIADTQDGHAAAELRQIHLEGLGIINTIGTTSQYHAYDIRVLGGKLVVGQYLAEGIQLAQTACDELGRLRPEIQDNDFLLLHIISVYKLKTRFKQQKYGLFWHYY